MTAAELAAALGKAHREGREWRCLCPAHADHTPSLSITEKDGQLLVICRAGCDQASVIDALKARGLWDLPERDENYAEPMHGRRLNITATYDYVDETEDFRFQVCRIEPGKDGRPKDFLQRRRNGTGWVWNTDGVERIPYHLNELAIARAQANGTPWRVYITEGEKCADRMRQDWHVTATTNPGGAGKWRASYAKYFSGADVVILPDNDDTGKKHAHTIAASLGPVATSVRILTLTGLPPKGDIFDWIDQGGTQSTLEELVDDLPQPAPAARPTGPFHTGTDFADNHQPANWLIQGILQKGRLYACTSLTSHGKTAVWLYNAAMIHAGRNVAANLTTEHGNVLFLAGENPEDLRARMLGMKRTFNLTTLPFVFPQAFPMTEDETNTLLQNIKAYLPPLALIIGDTAASYFPGDDENSNVQAGQYARNLRTLTTAPGNPAVVVLSHPTKHADNPTDLLPRGGGAFLNELDGNLTLWSTAKGETTTLHWHGKIRGRDFDPVQYRLKTVETGFTDNFGNNDITILAHPIDDFEAFSHAEQSTANEDAVLKALNDDPKRSLADIARTLGWIGDDGAAEKWRVQRALHALADARLVRNFRRKWQLTETGKNSLK